MQIVQKLEYVVRLSLHRFMSMYLLYWIERLGNVL